MREGWEYKKIGEICEIYQPKTISSNLLTKDGKYPVFGANGLIGRYCSYNHEEPEVLLCCRGATCGSINMSLPYSWINGNAMVVRPMNNIYIKSFLRYMLLTLDYSHIITGAAQPQITRTSLCPTLVPIPSLSDQQEIVDYLDTAFAKIDAMKANAEKALEEGKALFQSALKQLLEPKEGWEEKKLSDITEVKDGTHDSPKYVTDGIPFVTQKNITINGFDLSNTKKITVEDHKKFYVRSNVEFGDIIIAMIGANRGMSCIVDTRETFSIKNVGLIKKNENINIKYLLFYLHSPSANAYVQANSNGGAQEFIGLKGLRNFPIQYPPLSEQQAIVTTLDSIKSKVDRLQENYDKIAKECDTLKQAILRQVFE